MYTRWPHAQDMACIPWTWARELQVCACACLLRHKHGAEMHMHAALHTAIPSVGIMAHAWVVHRHDLPARTLWGIN